MSDPVVPPPALPADDSSESAGSALARLAVGLGVAVLVIVGFSLYLAREIRPAARRTGRDQTSAIVSTSLHIIRIQQNLSTLRGHAPRHARPHGAVPDRRRGPTPSRACASISSRRSSAGTRAGAGRAVPPGEQAQLEDINRRFWETLRPRLRAGRAGAGQTMPGGPRGGLIRGEATCASRRAREVSCRSSSSATRASTRKRRRGRAPSTTVSRGEVYVLAAVLVGAIALGGVALHSRARAARSRPCRRSRPSGAELSWRVLRMQEELQTTRSRASCTTSSGRFSRRSARCSAGFATCASGERGPADAATLTSDLDDVRGGLAQRTLDRIRTQSRMLHPVILDDFGLEQAVAWYVGEFARQHGVEAQFEPAGELGGRSRPKLDDSPVSHRAGSPEQRGAARAGHPRRRPSGPVGRGRGRPWESRTTAWGSPAGRAGSRRPRARGGIGITSMRERAELMGGRVVARARSAGRPARRGLGAAGAPGGGSGE